MSGGEIQLATHVVGLAIDAPAGGCSMSVNAHKQEVVATWATLL